MHVYILQRPDGLIKFRKSIPLSTGNVRGMLPRRPTRSWPLCSSRSASATLRRVVRASQY